MRRVGLLATAADLTAHEERPWVERLGADPIASLRPRERARVAGVLRAVSYPAPGTSHTRGLRAQLFDGTGSVELCWTGRRSVPGIEPGRRLVAAGMAVLQDSARAVLTIYNPRYELLDPERRTT